MTPNLDVIAKERSGRLKQSGVYFLASKHNPQNTPNNAEQNQENLARLGIIQNNALVEQLGGAEVDQ
jgi:hypothetical protein